MFFTFSAIFSPSKRLELFLFYFFEIGIESIKRISSNVPFQLNYSWPLFNANENLIELLKFWIRIKLKNSTLNSTLKGYNFGSILFCGKIHFIAVFFESGRGRLPSTNSLNILTTCQIFVRVEFWVTKFRKLLDVF